MESKWLIRIVQQCSHSFEYADCVSGKAVKPQYKVCPEENTKLNSVGWLEFRSGKFPL